MRNLCRPHCKFFLMDYNLNCLNLQVHLLSYLHNLQQIQSDTFTRPSITVTLKRPTVSSRFKITD